MMYEDYYKILQVDPSAEPEVITAAYRRLAQKYHPDAQPDSTTALRMRELNSAYEVLSNPDRRVQYDRTRSAQAPPPASAIQRVSPWAAPIAQQPAAAHATPAPARPSTTTRLAAIALGLVALLAIGTAALLLPPSSDPPQPDTSRVWNGECRDPAGYVFDCRVRIKITPANRVSGTVIWTLKVSPRPQERLAIGRQARASVRGTFDPASRRITMGSHSQDDPFDLVDANQYTLLLSDNERTLSGATYDDEILLGSLSATRKD